MKLKGMKMPKKTKKDATVTRAKAGSRRGRTKAFSTKGLGLGGSRDFTVRLPMTSMPRMMKAATRIVQGKPMFGIKRWTRMGKMTPPRDEPEAITPKARARR